MIETRRDFWDWVKVEIARRVSRLERFDRNGFAITSIITIRIDRMNSTTTEKKTQKGKREKKKEKQKIIIIIIITVILKL